LISGSTPPCATQCPSRNSIKGSPLSKLANIHKSAELFKAVAILMTQLTGSRFTIKETRAAYYIWLNSNFVETLPFGDFIQKMFRDAPSKVN
jgi:hypothetical protein